MKYSSPYISIIVPAYNAEKSLKKSIESIVEQEYKSYEIIIVNDGSKDGTKEVCQELVDLYPTIKIIDSENRGVSSARNLGLEVFWIRTTVCYHVRLRFWQIRQDKQI